MQDIGLHLFVRCPYQTPFFANSALAPSRSFALGTLERDSLTVRCGNADTADVEMASWLEAMVTRAEGEGWSEHSMDGSGRVAGGAREAAVFPELFPIPDAVQHFFGQRESELMREQAYLAAMVGFVRKHVADHFQADRPGPSPGVPVKVFDAAATAAKRFREHFRAASGAFGQSRACLARGAARAVELAGNFQVRSGQPNPFGADIVDVGEDRGDGAGLAGWLGFPGGRIEMLDQHLVHAVVGGEDTDRGPGEWNVELGLPGGHGSLLLDQG
jgi:hypothetical protein